MDHSSRLLCTERFPRVFSVSIFASFFLLIPVQASVAARLFHDLPQCLLLRLSFSSYSHRNPIARSSFTGFCLSFSRPPVLPTSLTLSPALHASMHYKYLQISRVPYSIGDETADTVSDSGCNREEATWTVIRSMPSMHTRLCCMHGCGRRCDGILSLTGHHVLRYVYIHTYSSSARVDLGCLILGFVSNEDRTIRDALRRFVKYLCPLLALVLLSGITSPMVKWKYLFDLTLHPRCRYELYLHRISGTRCNCSHVCVWPHTEPLLLSTLPTCLPVYQCRSDRIGSLLSVV